MSQLLASNRTAPTLLVALVLTVLSWQTSLWFPQAGLDPSWQAGLAMAFHQHVQWGPGVDFTYGPLGFLMEPALYYAGTAALGATYLLLFRWFLFVLLLHVARPKFLGYWAVLVAYIVGAFVIVLVDPADALMACPLLVAVLAMRSGSERVMARAAFALGGLAAAGLLVKFSVGLLAVSIALVTAASAKRWWRSVLSVLATFLVTLMALWVATGNSLGNLPLYLRTAASIAGGFAGAMSGEQVGRYEYWYYAAIVTALLTVSLALGLRAASRRANICAWLVFLGYTWVVLKEGFVRHDNYHDWVFFCLMPVALIAVPRPQRPLLGRSHLSISAFTVGTLCLAMLVTCKAGDYFPPSHIKGDAQSLVSDIKTLLSPSKLNRLIEQARPALRPSYDLPSSFLRQLRGQTVAIEPWENTVAWAFPGINWRPEPVLQQYSAYESSLDELDASFLLSADAPTRILVQPMQLYESDFSDPFLGAPAATVTRFCRYRQVGASANWQLLDRVRDRCGGLVPITMLKVAYGETVVVPAAAQGDAVVATFAGVGSSLRYRLENILLKAPEIQLQTPSGTYRFIAGTAPDLHMLRLPSTLGYSTEYCPPNISSFSLIDRNSSAGHYSVSFYELPMRP